MRECVSPDHASEVFGEVRASKGEADDHPSPRMLRPKRSKSSGGTTRNGVSIDGPWIIHLLVLSLIVGHCCCLLSCSGRVSKDNLAHAWARGLQDSAGWFMLIRGEAGKFVPKHLSDKAWVDGVWQ